MNDRLLHAAELNQLAWLEIDLTLLAHAPARRSHPLVVLEALLKGVFEATRLDAKQVKQLWHCPGQRVHQMGWQDGTRIPLTVQLFGMPVQALPTWQNWLVERFAPTVQPNFTLEHIAAWRLQHPPPTPTPASTLTLEFLTPLPLPHTPGQPRTELDASGFQRLCQTRLRKLFGREGELPPPMTLDTSGWHYWRVTHRSRSQNGHPMFINGCVGPLTLSGETLTAWLPWIALFSAIGLGERLSFSQGRFQITSPVSEPAETPPAPLQLRRPFILERDRAGAQLKLAHDNLVVSQESGPNLELPLMRIAHIALHSPCQISTPLLTACAQEGIPLIVAAPGRPPLVIVGQQAEAQRNRRLAAHHAAWAKLEARQRARLGARLVDQKLASCAWLVRQRYQPGDHQLLQHIQRARQALTRVDSLDLVRGWEGWAARHYHRWLRQRLQGLGANPARRHPGSDDPINSLLNYVYALLRQHLAYNLRLTGLDPWLGILHEANGRHEALVSDFMEPWRAHLDRLLLRMHGLKIIQPHSFAEIDGQMRLTLKARERLVQSFTQMLEATPRNGGPRLATRIKAMLESYAAAAMEDKLAEWAPPECASETLVVPDET